MILSLGAAECGLNLFRDILARQRGVQATMEHGPLLPWQGGDMRHRIAQRLERFQAKATGKYLADAGSSYLPYLEDAIAIDPEIRVIALRRPREEAISVYCQRLEQFYAHPVDHWAADLEPPWTQDFFRSRSYPKYDSANRYEGMCRYWEEYYQQVDQLIAKYPNNVRLWDATALTEEAGVEGVLNFAGIDLADRVIVTGTKTEATLWSPDRINTPKPPAYPNRMDPRRCVILVPYQGLIQRDCEEALKELENRGYEVRRVQGYAAIDQGRNQLVTDAMRDGFHEVLWIDSDVGFQPDAVEKLRSHPQWIVCGIYPQKNKRSLASHIMPGTKSMTFGRDGGLTKILYAGTGFLLIRREALWTIFDQLQLPLCNERFGKVTIPFFQPMVREIEDGHWYLAEDFAFGERARQCGLTTYADTSIRLWHIGNYRFGWEDAGMDRPRYGTFTMHFEKKQEADVVSHVEDRLANFVADHPWPKEAPQAPLSELPEVPSHDVMQLLSSHMNSHTQLVLEVGSDSGQMTRILAMHPSGAAIIALEDWPHDDRIEEGVPPATTVRLENFQCECWEQRRRIIPVARDYASGLQQIADADLKPNFIVVNDNHQRQLSGELLAMIYEYFPGITVIGNRFEKDRMGNTLRQVAEAHELQFKALDKAWLMHA